MKNINPFIETLGRHKGHHSMTSRRVAWCTFEQPCTDVVDHPINTSAQVYRGTNYKVGPPQSTFLQAQEWPNPSTGPTLMWTISNQNRPNLGRSIGVLDGITVRSTTAIAECEGYDHGLRANGTR